MRAFYPGSRLLYSIFLGSLTPLGGVLTLTSCGFTANNTVLYIGTGCPTWDRPFGCVVGNDNAAPVCGSNMLASAVAIIAQQATYYVQLGGVNGEHVVSSFQWSYAAPSASGSVTRTRTSSKSRSRSGSRSRTRSSLQSRSRSGSRTRKPKL